MAVPATDASQPDSPAILGVPLAAMGEPVEQGDTRPLGWRRGGRNGAGAEDPEQFGAPAQLHHQQEPLHQAVEALFDQTSAQQLTSAFCIAEMLWLEDDPGDPRILAAQNPLFWVVSRSGIEPI